MSPTTPEATVLLVDDDQDLLAVYSESLLPDFHSDTASSVKDAEAMMKEKRYKVVVSDHNMPGGDGLSFLSRVRKQHPETVRLLLTSHLDAKLLNQLGQAEPYRYLLKPISITDLLKTVREAATLHDRGPAGTGS